MARVAHEVMVEAERGFRRADALSAAMEPHLLKRMNDSAIYGYTNDRADCNVPPGDVLLAAALAAGISLDRKLGVAAGPRDEEIADLHAQVAEMRDELAHLRAEVIDRTDAAAPAPDDRTLAAAKAERAARLAPGWELAARVGVRRRDRRALRSNRGELRQRSPVPNLNPAIVRSSSEELREAGRPLSLSILVLVRGLPVELLGTCVHTRSRAFPRIGPMVPTRLGAHGPWLTGRGRG